MSTTIQNKIKKKKTRFYVVFVLGDIRRMKDKIKNSNNKGNIEFDIISRLLKDKGKFFSLKVQKYFTMTFDLSYSQNNSIRYFHTNLFWDFILDCRFC